MRSILLLILMTAAAMAGEAGLTRNGVTVAVTVEADAGGPVVVAVFTPEHRVPPLHLYGKDLSADLPGIATRLELAPGAPAQARGPLTDDQPVQVHDGLSIYPPGSAVTLRLPITAPAGSGTVAVPLLVSYMACTFETCLIPVQRAALSVAVPAAAPASSPVAAAPAIDPEALRGVVREELAAAERRIRSAVHESAERSADPRQIRWRHPATPAEAEALIREAHAAGKAAILDFTGPSCVNCQLMAKTVFRLPAVAAAWNEQTPIEIDTDPPHEALAAWQQERFATQNRPLYVRIAPDGATTRWDHVFATGDEATLGRFLAFVRGAGAGDAGGTGTGLGEFILLAILGGLFTLVMPCTYPMIPLTINVFTKQAASGARLLPLALFYGAGIVGCFVGLGVVITGVCGASLASLAGHPLTNLLIGALFAVLGASLLGAFFLRPPAWLGAAVGGGKGGYLGALLMGLTFAVTAFTCTAPFAGAVLAAGVSSGAWGAAVGGMAIYSGVIALPFVALALSPRLLARMPKAGAWMEEFKIVGGLIEIAAAFKFLAICDHAWGWGVIGRTSTLTVWSAIGLACATYVMGWWRHEGDERVESVGLGRLSAGLAFAAVAIWLAAGLAGLHLGFVEAFFPGDAAP